MGTAMKLLARVSPCSCPDRERERGKQKTEDSLCCNLRVLVHTSRASCTSATLVVLSVTFVCLITAAAVVISNPAVVTLAAVEDTAGPGPRTHGLFSPPEGNNPGATVTQTESQKMIFFPGGSGSH
jgi:hypothetical protein